MKTSLRTVTCGAVSSESVGQNVVLCGWVHNIRDIGKLVFIDLRDHYGTVQLVSEGELAKELRKIPKESTIQVFGNVQKKLDESGIEVRVEKFSLLSSSQELPFPVNQETEIGETLKHQYRFLHLRRERAHYLVTKRVQVINLIRQVMASRNFLEIHTPILTGTSPEGARDFLVPSRRFKGKFYALPQAPQQFKQLLMMSGFDRYFQIAPCFRDEDPRADRHAGEFYQLDAEMAFVTQEDIIAEFESIFIELLERIEIDRPVSKPFYRMSFDESLIKTGSDKPDTRAKIFFEDITCFSDAIPVSDLALQDDEFLACLSIPVEDSPSRKIFDTVRELGNELLNTNVFYLFLGNETKGTLAKFLDSSVLVKIKEKFLLEPQQKAVLIFLKRKKSLQPQAEQFRVEVAKLFGKFNEKEISFCWITDFPFFELDEDGRIQFCHNPFSMPQGGIEALMSCDPLKIKAFQFDLALNGYELSSGAVRNHELETLLKAFEIVGYSREKTLETFPGITTALRYGPPPHGGMAPGIERFLMVLFDEPNVREVIPFPLTQNGQDLLMNAPSDVDAERLKELGLRLDL
ncbi:MAG: aspartate--tRNA ligase [Deltaproteobacteria bacterium]|nr:aspartate--tRNA ligase [Deltaproteobacteria bacterium]